MKALIKTTIAMGILLMGGCSEQNFHDNFRSYGQPTATYIENDIVIDEFRAIYLDPVDILFVVDDTCSMADDQRKLADHLPTLANELLKLDINYRIGFTTISDHWYEDTLRPLPGKHRYHYWIDPETPAKRDLFVYGAMPGTASGWGPEAGFTAAYNIFGNLNPYSFFRDNSSFHIITISDEPEQTDAVIALRESLYGGDISSSKKVETPRKFANKLADFRENSSFSIIGESPDYRPQTKYQKAAALTGGYVIDMNEDNWDTFLVEFANNIEFNPEFWFHLSHIPADYTKLHIEVCEDVDGDGQCVSWSTSDDITYIYRYNKKNWSYEYNMYTNSVLLVSPRRELQDYDYVRIKYEIPTGGPAGMLEDDGEDNNDTGLF